MDRNTGPDDLCLEWCVRAVDSVQKRVVRVGCA